MDWFRFTAPCAQLITRTSFPCFSLFRGGNIRCLVTESLPFCLSCSLSLLSSVSFSLLPLLAFFFLSFFVLGFLFRFLIGVQLCIPSSVGPCYQSARWDQVGIFLSCKLFCVRVYCCRIRVCFGGSPPPFSFCDHVWHVSCCVCWRRLCAIVVWYISVSDFSVSCNALCVSYSLASSFCSTHLSFFCPCLSSCFAVGLWS